MTIRFIIFFLLISANCFSQDVYTDTIMVRVSDFAFKKDTGQSSAYILHFKAGFQPVSSLASVDITFLDQNNNQVGSYGLFDVKKHQKGFYYLESITHELLTVNSENIRIIIPFGKTEYNSFSKLRIVCRSIHHVSETTIFAIPKS